MINTGDVVSYLYMCAIFGVKLQRGMNFRLLNRIRKPDCYFIALTRAARRDL